MPITDSLKSEAKPSLLDLITAETTVDQLGGLVALFISPADEIALGGKQEANKMVLKSISYARAFPPGFDFNASGFFATTLRGVPTDTATRILEIDKKMGIISDHPNKPERLTISERWLTAARNQFWPKPS